MILDFLVVLMTQNFADQKHFYKDVLETEVIFENQDTVGLGKAGKLFIVLREDQYENSHHLAEHKGSQIITFKCNGDINQYTQKIANAGFKIRDTLQLAEYHTQYLFIEDYDGNEICLDFPFSE